LCFCAFGHWVGGMRIFMLTVLTMIAFAANSVLARLALVDGAIDPVSFGTIRVVAGAVALAGLVLWQDLGFSLGGRHRILGVGALLLYIYGFSVAYLVLDAGMGALILFGVVQITMFGGAVLRRDVVPWQRWIGAALAFGGLVWLLVPTGAAPVSGFAVMMMGLAGVGWGLYSLVGQQARNATQETAMNFLVAAPLGIVIWVMLPTAQVTIEGVGLAILSGVLTSGMGYALWYGILPALGASRAAVAQLSVPVIAMAGGVIFLGEAPDTRFLWASLLVLGGVLVSVMPVFELRR